MKKFVIALVFGSALWLAMPFFTPFNTGDAFYDLGAQLLFVIQAWIIVGIIALISKIRNKRKNKQSQLV